MCSLCGVVIVQQEGAMRKTIWTLTVLTSIFFASNCLCDENKGEGTITPEQFVSLYVDLSIVAEQNLSDTLKLAAVQDSIFKAHNITREQFNRFREEMDKEPQKWKGLWEEIVKKLQERDRKARQKKSEPREKTSDKEKNE